MIIKNRELTVVDWRGDGVSKPGCRLEHCPSEMQLQLQPLCVVTKTRNLVRGAQVAYFRASQLSTFLARLTWYEGPP
jgi:hypothetical protein